MRGTALFGEVQRAFADSAAVAPASPLALELDEAVAESSAALCTVLLLAARTYPPLRAALGGDGSRALAR